MTLRNMLSKRSQIQKSTYCMIPFTLEETNLIYSDRKADQ